MESKLNNDFDKIHEWFNQFENDELDALASLITQEIQRRKHTCEIHLETCYGFRNRHGRAYVARLFWDPAIRDPAIRKIGRTFIEPTMGIKEDKCKSYHVWEFDAHEGDYLEARLDDGSAKHDMRNWFLVDSTYADNLCEIKSSEALSAILSHKTPKWWK